MKLTHNNSPPLLLVLRSPVKTIYGYGFLPAEKWDMVHMVFGAEMTIMSIFRNGSVVAYANNNSSKIRKICTVDCANKCFDIVFEILKYHFFSLFPFYFAIASCNPNM